MSEREPIVRRVSGGARSGVGGVTAIGLVLLVIAVLSAVIAGMGPWVAIWGGLGLVVLVGGRIIDAIRSR